jgi:hypothetical protein
MIGIHPGQRAEGPAVADAQALVGHLVPAGRLKNRTAALNLRTLIGRGLAREDGTWALA